MNKYIMKAAAYGTVMSLAFSAAGLKAEAKSLSDVLPSAGISYTLGNNSTSLSQLYEESSSTTTPTEEVSNESSVLGASAAHSSSASDSTTMTATLLSTSTASTAHSEQEDSASGVTTTSGKVIQDTVIVSKGYTDDLASAADLDSEEEGFKNLVIAQVTNYVNVRSIPGEDGDIVGKLYNNSVGSFIEEDDGWYKISSGNVEGYVKAEFCVTGDAAVELAKKVGTRIATVTTTTLYVREAATTESSVVGMVPIEDELIVTEEQEGWVKVNIEEGDGFVSTDYVTLSTEFVKAESKAEEEARLAKEEQERQAARAASASRSSSSSSGSSSRSSYTDTGVYQPAGSGTGANVASFALQFVGNPYVYGGTSLTNGADCSGFVMSVYSNFGVSLPHSSSADRSVGSTVSSLAEAQAGDIVCYSGHVGIYIGNGQIVHASTAATGIKVSDASYRTILSIRRIF